MTNRYSRASIFYVNRRMRGNMVIGQRKGFWDKLRVLATCTVVFLHTLTGAVNNTAPAVFPNGEKSYLIIMDLICWCVPMFLMISRYIFLRPCWVPDMRIMASRYCPRILLALSIFGIPYACIERIAAEKSFSLKTVGMGFLDVLRGRGLAACFTRLDGLFSILYNWFCFFRILLS